MSKDYREYLEEELKKAQQEFEKAKMDSIKEIEKMSVFMAEDFGAAYTSHIDKITAAAARVKALGEAMQVFDYMQNN